MEGSTYSVAGGGCAACAVSSENDPVAPITPEWGGVGGGGCKGWGPLLRPRDFTMTHGVDEKGGAGCGMLVRVGIHKGLCW